MRACGRTGPGIRRSVKGEQRGIYVRTNDGKWDKQNADRIKDNLTHRGIEGGLQKDLLGWISDNPFYLVAKPFAGEYPGNREWNLLGSQLLYAPAEADGPTTHWDMILNHIGRGLDAAVESDPWCQEHKVSTGADYLRLWIANLIREPARRRPMLAMYSPEQGTGKSTLHLATAMLFDENGFEYGDAALKNEKGFKGELEGKALCAVEETNLANYKEAYIRRAGAVALTDAGRRAVLAAFERRMDTLVTHPVFDYRISYRRVLEVQARLLGRALLGEIAEYPSFCTR